MRARQSTIQLSLLLALCGTIVPGAIALAAPPITQKVTQTAPLAEIDAAIAEGKQLLH